MTRRRDGLAGRGGLFEDADFDYEARIMLGAAACGVGDVGAVLATIDRIDDGDARSWFESWAAVAAVFAARGKQAVEAGHTHTAHWALVTASQYYGKALVFVDGMADQSVFLPTFRAHRDCWDQAVDASEGRHVRLRVPYEDGLDLPGYLLRPDASGAARPTLVMTNGSDGTLPSMLSYGAQEALSRGWNAFLYDGPGQQSMLFEHQVPFRPDWEAVLTPVIDTLVARTDVNEEALLGYGISQAGYWITRAVAFEHRLKAAVADPGVVDVSASWTSALPAPLLALLDAGRKDEFNTAVRAHATPAGARTLAFRSKPYAADNLFDLISEVRAYQVRDVVGQITTPLLVLDPDDEQFFPGQPRELYDLLPNEKRIMEFTADLGANWHCQPTGRRLTHTAMLDYLGDHLSAHAA